MPTFAMGIVVILAACGGPAGSAHGTSDPVTPTAPLTLPTATPGPTTGPGDTQAAPSPTAGTAVPTGGSWAEVAAVGDAPPAREDHTWTVDERGAAAWLFGGRDGSTLHDDLWSYDLATDTWSRVKAEGPAPAARFGHEAAWIPGLGLVVTLGQAGPRFFDDIWLFDPATSTWRELPDAGATPVARYGSCSGLGPDGRLWISHGFTADGVRFADTLAYDFDAEGWAEATPPGDGPVARCLHTCWWTSAGDFVLYGGQTTGVPALGDLWVLDRPDGGDAGWTEAPDPGPAARQLAAVGRAGETTVVFGGRANDRKPLGDLWVLPDGGGEFAELSIDGPAPAARSGAALIDDQARDRLLLFGGIGDEALDDLWALSLD